MVKNTMFLKKSPCILLGLQRLWLMGNRFLHLCCFSFTHATFATKKGNSNIIWLFEGVNGVEQEL